MAETFEATLKELNKKYGAGTIIMGKQTSEDLEVVDTGSISFNKATSIGGLPIGKLVEIYGPESSGKSTICYHIIANFQKVGKKVVLCDAEQSFDRKYATALGIDVDKLIIVQPECQEDGYNVVEGLIDTGEVGLVVIDSHTAMIPRKIVDSDVGEATIGLQARVNSIALAKIHPKLSKKGCTMLAVSQTRTNIGGYGDVNIATGGKSYKFYSDMRIKVFRNVEKDDSQDRTTIEVIKNKCGVPYGKATFVIRWGVGIDRVQEMIDIAIEKKVIEKAGAWYSFELGEMTGKYQGNEKLHNALSTDVETLKQLYEKATKV